jgi:hypothetical protein
VRELTFLVLMVPGYVFFWTLLRVDPVPKKYPYGVSMWITGAEVIGDAFFGIAVIAYQTLIGGAYYHALARPWGPSLETDQILGGGVLWILGDLVGLPFLAAVLIHMMREDESDAARIDAELDAQEAELKAKRQAAHPATPAPAAPAPAAPAPAAPAASAAGPPAAAPSVAAPSVAAEPAAAEPAAPDAPADPRDERPPLWWETDPRFTTRFKPTR